MGTECSLAVNSAGGVCIAYKDDSNNDLKLQFDLSVAFQSFIVDAASNVGNASAIAVGPNKRLFVSYLQSSGNDTKGAIIPIKNATDNNCDGF